MANIGIDLDDVVADFIGPFSAICYDLFGSPEPGTRAVDWEFSNFGLTEEQLNEAWKKVASTKNFWEMLPVADGASKEMLRSLDILGNNLFFITSRLPSAGKTIKHQSCEWLKNVMSLDNPTVIHSYNKGPLAFGLQLDYFIDDRPKNAIEVRDNAYNCAVYIKDAPHNQSFDNNKLGIVRIDSFDSFAATIVRETLLSVLPV